MTAANDSTFGVFLDRLPKALYVVAHLAFLAVGLLLWMQLRSTAFPHPGALLLYAASQVIFFGFFANWITFKMAVLVEQMLMLGMVWMIATGAV
jgi:hypothetical protein